MSEIYYDPDPNQNTVGTILQLTCNDFPNEYSSNDLDRNRRIIKPANCSISNCIIYYNLINPLINLIGKKKGHTFCTPFSHETQLLRLLTKTNHNRPSVTITVLQPNHVQSVLMLFCGHESTIYILR